jgi:hypothetical protein
VTLGVSAGGQSPSGELYATTLSVTAMPVAPPWLDHSEATAAEDTADA